MRDFARVDKYGNGLDIRMQDLNVDSDRMLSVTEYAGYLAAKAKLNAQISAPPSQPLAPSK
jgi:hypothetical protein